MKTTNILAAATLAILLYPRFKPLLRAIFRRFFSTRAQLKDSSRRRRLKKIQKLGSKPGSIISLSRGKTRYVLSGPKDSPLVVAFHGFGVFGFVYDDMAKRLNGQNYQTLVFDFYGSGFSDSPPPEHFRGGVSMNRRQVGSPQSRNN